MKLSKDRLSQILRLSDNFKRRKSEQPPPRVLPSKRPKNRKIQQQPSYPVMLKARKTAQMVKEIKKPHSKKPSSRSAKLSISSKPLSSLSRASKARLSRVASGSNAPRSRKEEVKSRGLRIPLTRTRERLML